MKDQFKAQQHLSDLERSLSNLQTLEDKRSFIQNFEMDESLHDQYAPQIYLKVWRIAFDAGKIKLANSYAKKAFQYLSELKRIPALKNFFVSLEQVGLHKNFKPEYKNFDRLLLGNKKITNEDLNFFHVLSDHPEHWKTNASFLKQYLLIEEEWTMDQWKYCYEFILTQSFDKDLFLMLLEKSRERNKAAVETKIVQTLKEKKIKVPATTSKNTAEATSSNQTLNADYDDIALRVLSGSKVPNEDEQRRVISSLKFISDEELAKRGHDMIVAFELLGMEQVVQTLCEKMSKTVDDVKKLASIYYVWAQSLANSDESFKAVDLIDDVLSEQPLFDEERLAFLYLKAEILLKLKKKSLAKEIYTKIKKHNPHYRLVGERLREIEKN